MKNGLKASSIRKLLAVVLVLLVAGVGVGFYYGIGILRDYATDVSHTVADADASSKNVENLRKLKQTLAESETLITKAEKLFATNENYQSQAVIDVQRYASEAGIIISNTSFTEDGGSGAGTSNGRTLILTLQTPLSYAKLIRFLDGVESNLPKLQVTGITITRVTPVNGDLVNVDKINLKVSIR